LSLWNSTLQNLHNIKYKRKLGNKRKELASICYNHALLEMSRDKAF
jgi:hypothetical protein